jgi:alkanesulfonate monooxygenase SsuD/methylene tetrahydromethanopterin reductase-like flavin-dependent oxidoreductase (luciferase family)
MENFEETIDPQWLALINHMLSCRIVGSLETVKAGLRDFVARTGADEIMVTGQIFDHEARKHSFEIAAKARDELTEEKAANSEQPAP